MKGDPLDFPRHFVLTLERHEYTVDFNSACEALQPGDAMRGIRLSNLFDSSEGSNADSLQRHTGFRLVRDGKDWVIPADDPALLAGPRPVLIYRHKPFELKEKYYKDIADEIASQYLATDLESYLKNPPTKISIPGGFGVSTTLQNSIQRYFFSNPVQLKRELVETILPSMVKDFASRFALPVRIDVSYQQSLLSIPKIALLLKLFGKDEGARRIFDRNALRSVLPAPTDLQGYVDALLFVAPHAFALPLTRPGSSLYFLSKGAWLFPRTVSENIFEQLGSDSEPAVQSKIEGLFAAPGPGGHIMRTYVVCAIDSVNSLMRFLNDPRNFVTLDGEFNTQLNIQAQSAIRLMFADLLAMNFTGAFHIKHRLAFQFLDKLANLIALFSKEKLSETNIFQKLLSIDTGNEIANIVSKGVLPRNRPLSDLLGRSIRLTYKRVHDHVTLKVGDPKTTEAQRLSHLRTLRNLGHGTNLHGQQFEQTFLGGSMTIPSELIYVPLFLALALGLAPEKLLRRSW